MTISVESDIVDISNNLSEGYTLKITIINASFRKNGATAKILNEFANQLRVHPDTDIDFFHLSDLKIEFCNGCCNCYKAGACFLEDDAEMLSQAISESDGLIIGTPCYASNVSGQLKTFIDRGHFVIEQLLKDKHAIGIVTYENAGANAVYKALKALFVFSGAKTTDKLVFKIPFDSDPITNKRMKDQIIKKASKLHYSIKNKKTSLISRITHFFVLNFGVKPFVLNKGQAYQGVLQHWKERGVSHKSV